MTAHHVNLMSVGPTTPADNANAHLPALLCGDFELGHVEHHALPVPYDR